MTPSFTSCAFSAASRLTNSDAGSSAGSCSTSFPSHREIEDGLTEGLDLVEAGGERSEIFEGEGGVDPECRRIRIGRVEADETRRRQPVPRCFPLRSRRLQLIAERHQFIDLGDDAVLFGEGWEGKNAFDMLCVGA